MYYNTINIAKKNDGIPLEPIMLHYIVCKTFTFHTKAM